MNASNFQEYLRRPSTLFQLDLNELRLLIEEYPYCQNLHYLLAKKGQLENLPEFKKYLSNAAVYSPDRAFLFSKIKRQSDGRLKNEEQMLEFGPLPAHLSATGSPITEKTTEFETSKPMISFEEENSPEALAGANLEVEEDAPAELGEETIALSDETADVESVTDNESESGDSYSENENKEEKITEIVSKEHNKLERLSVLDQMLNRGTEYQGKEAVEEDITDEIIIKRPVKRIVRVQKVIKMEEVKNEHPETKTTPGQELNTADLGNPVASEDSVLEEIVMENNVFEDLSDKKHIIAERDVDIEQKFVDTDEELMPLEIVSSEPAPEQKECEHEENGPRTNLIVNQNTIEDVKNEKNKDKADKKAKKAKKALKAKEEKLQKEKESKIEKKKKKKKKGLKNSAGKSVLKYDDIASETLAKLLAKQGSTKAAIEIYERLCILNADKTSAYKKIIRKLKKK